MPRSIPVRVHGFLVAVALVGPLSVGSALGQTPTFVPVTTPLGSVLPASLNTGDLNGDTYPDLVCCGRTSTGAGFVKAYIGDAVGGFTSAITSTPSGPVSAAATGDFDGDGRDDLALAIDLASTAGSITVHLGNGMGSFTQSASQAIVGRPGAVAVGDLDNDGKLDVVVVDLLSPGTGIVKRSLGDGTGGLGSLSSIGSGNNQIAIADLNLDGKRDLVVASDGNPDFKTYLGDGTGSFGSPSSTAAPAVPDGLVVGDVNGDGKPDVVLTLIFQSGVKTFLGDGLGGFGFPISSTGASGLTRLALGDVNGDGHMDLGGDFGASSVGVFTGGGSGSFTSSVTLPAGFLPRGFVFLDMEKDGRLDMAAVNLAVPVLTRFHNFVAPVGIASYGTGTPGCDGPHTLTANSTPYLGNPGFQLRCDNAPPLSLGLVIIGDVPDLSGSDPFSINALLHVDLFSSSVVLTADFYGTIAGNGAAPLPLPFVPAILGNTFYTMGLFVWAPGCPAVQPFGISTTKGMSMTIQSPDPSSSANLTTVATLTAGSAPSSVHLADVNQDFFQDLLVTDSGGSQVLVFLGTGGTGYAAPSSVATGLDPSALTTSDFDGDGKLDFAAADTGADAVTVALGDGTGSFTPSGPYAVGTAPVALAVGDLDNDGNLDLLVANRDSDDLTPLLGDGLGSFTAGTPVPSGTSPRAILWHDVSGDGHADALVVCGGANSVEVSLSDGLGGFGSPVSHGVGSAPVGATLADIDNDGKLDLVVANSGSNSVSLLGGNGLGGFAAAQNSAAGSDPVAVLVGDVNRDLRRDLLVVNRAANTVSVLPGNNTLTPFAPLSFPVGTSPVGLAGFVPSFDGKMRVFTANTASGDVTILAVP